MSTMQAVFKRFTLILPGTAVFMGTRLSSLDPGMLVLAQEPAIAAQLEEAGDDAIFATLVEDGWTSMDRAEIDNNRARILWTACMIAEPAKGGPQS